MKSTKITLLLMMIIFLAASCKKEKIEANDEELITTMELTFTPSDGGAPVVYKYEDIDGPGGLTPTTDQILLKPNKIYSVAVKLLNKTANPVEDITEEIKTESDAHRFYYLASANSNIAISEYDKDNNNVSLGLSSKWTTEDVAEGTIKITLRHYAGTPPNKLESDPADSPKSNTDIEVLFSTKIQ